MSAARQEFHLLQKFQTEGRDVLSCDFAPDFTLITGSSDKTVRIWEWQAGVGFMESPNSPLVAHKYQVSCVKVSPQGTMFASASVDGTAALWNLFSCTKLYTMTHANGDSVRVCRFSPDSSIFVTAGDSGALCVWDLAHRTLIRTINDHVEFMSALAFTPDSQFLISADCGEILRVWYVEDVADTTSGQNCVPLIRMDDIVDMGALCVDVAKTIKYDDDNPLIRQYTLAVCGNSNEIGIWSMISTTLAKHQSTKKQITLSRTDIFDGHSCSVTCVKFNNTATQLVSASVDKSIKVWDMTGNCLANLQGHTRYVNCIAIAKDNSLIATGFTGGNDALIFVWDVNGNITLDSNINRRRLSLNSPDRENEIVRNVEQTMVTDIRLIEKYEEVADSSINSCCFWNNELLAIGGGDNLVKLFKLENESLDELDFSPLERHTYPVNCVTFSKSGHLVGSCSQDGFTILWDSSTGEVISSLHASNLSVKICCISPNEELLVTAGDDENITVWNTNSMEKIATLEGHLDTVTSASFSPDGLFLLSTCFNEDLRAWNMETFTLIKMEENAHEMGVTCCDISENLEPFSHPGRFIQGYMFTSGGNDGLIKLWKIEAPKDKRRVKVDNMEIRHVRTLEGHGSSITGVRFAPSLGGFLCSTSADRQARIWSSNSGECLHVLDHNSIVTSCSFSKNNLLLVTACLDRSVWLWKIPQELIFQTSIANNIASRSKSVVDWTVGEVALWFEEINFVKLSPIIHNIGLDGQKLLTTSDVKIMAALEVEDEADYETLSKELRWLKQGEKEFSDLNTNTEITIPDEFLCPITQEVMRNPVTCEDGFTYEKRAITEWFMSGKITSPMTNEPLESTAYKYNVELRNKIWEFIDNLDR